MMRMTAGKEVIKEGERFSAKKHTFVQDPPVWGMGPDEEPPPRMVTIEVEGTLQIEMVYKGYMLMDDGKRISVDNLSNIIRDNTKVPSGELEGSV